MDIKDEGAFKTCRRTKAGMTEECLVRKARLKSCRAIAQNPSPLVPQVAQQCQQAYLNLTSSPSSSHSIDFYSFSDILIYSTSVKYVRCLSNDHTCFMSACSSQKAEICASSSKIVTTLKMNVLLSKIPLLPFQFAFQVYLSTTS